MEGLQEKKWFVYLQDHHEGPFSLEELEGKMAQGHVSPQNYVWSEGMMDWELMSSIGVLKSLVSQKQEPPAAVVPTEVTVGSEGAEQEEVQKEAQKEIKEEDKKDRRFSRIFKGFLILLVPILFGLVFSLGLLNPLLKVSAIQSALQEVNNYIKPRLLSVSEKIPMLSVWISPIPTLSDVSPEEYQELKAVAASPLSREGPKVTVALSKADPVSPFFYIVTNLNDGAEFDVSIEGIAETLLNQLFFSSRAHAVISKKLGKTEIVRFLDGRPAPKGEYLIYVYESERQSQEIFSLLSQFEPAAVALSAELPKGRKVVIKKSYFIGGEKDATYEERLKEYHEKLRIKASVELDEIKQFVQTLDSQLSASFLEFARLRKSGSGPGPRRAWDAFHAKWQQLDEQLQNSFKKWTPESIQNELFYGKLYSLLQGFDQVVGRVHAVHHSYYTSKVDLKSFEIQLGEVSSQAQAALSELKSKVEQVEKLSSTQNGMPRREGL